jgi:hypothetical protein
VIVNLPTCRQLPNNRQKYDRVGGQPMSTCSPLGRKAADVRVGLITGKINIVAEHRDLSFTRRGLAPANAVLSVEQMRIYDTGQ